MQILNLCLGFVFLVMAYVSFLHGPEMIQKRLGKTFLAGFSLFWFLRMLEQAIFFDIKSSASVIIILVSLVGCVLYLLAVLEATP